MQVTIRPPNKRLLALLAILPFSVLILVLIYML